MDVDTVLKKLKSLASKSTSAMAERRGVKPETLLGVSTGDIRKLAKALGQSETLADDLWRQPFHEAHLLAILVAALADRSVKQLNNWVVDISSWGTCDQYAKRLSEQRHDVAELVSAWTLDEALYVKRAGLALMANHCMKQHELGSTTRQQFTDLIAGAANDDRQHVKQAACWALRELGKIDTGTHEIAIELALELSASAGSANVWVGKCAYKELELLVKIPERRRLISRKSKTASKYFD